ncbi:MULTISPECIES: hypothetical protein [Dermabacter]|uniref:hypothetical protein n=1 Tax=Dermabacter TaxID=36739 RepID=UPI0021A4A292|nr:MULTISPECIES: hypothetical protein [Dermabacter]MCT1955082.1 hypothetical protein [Dermabacter hominis]MDU1122281.1 hypothetical protein [Dermabacter sp.]MDU1463605.1 hypothetical protein [Dermabacter sp.]MDU4693021.1 hypothetical protein [Dermabacter sp.]
MSLPSLLANNHRSPARVWVILATVALVCVVLGPLLAPGAMWLVPVASESPGDSSPLAGLDELVSRAFAFFFVFGVFFGAGNFVGLTAVPFAIAALTRCDGAGRIGFALTAIIVFILGPLLAVLSAAAMVALSLSLPTEASSNPATGAVRAEWEGLRALLVFGTFAVPLAIDLVRFAVLSFAGVIVYSADPRSDPTGSALAR